MRRLIIRSGAIGDCITCFPVMQWLATEYTELWVPSLVRPLIHFGNRVRSLIDTGINNVELTPELRRYLAGFDQIISWFGSNRPDFRVSMPSTTQFLSALPGPEWHCSATDFFASQVGAPLGMVPTIVIPQEKLCRGSLVIHPFSGSQRKNWKLNGFADIASRVVCSVEWLAGPNEEFPGAYRIDDLAELAAWLSSASVYLGNDSGISHLAAAVGIPTVVLFGPTNATVWAPRGENVSILEGGSSMAISVDQVVSAVQARFNGAIA